MWRRVARGRDQIETQGSSGWLGRSERLDVGETTGGGVTMGAGVGAYPPGLPLDALSLIDLSWRAAPAPAGRTAPAGPRPAARRAEERTPAPAATVPGIR